MTNTTPSINSTSFNCPHCSALTSHDWYRVYGRFLDITRTPSQLERQLTNKLTTQLIKTGMTNAQARMQSEDFALRNAGIEKNKESGNFGCIHKIYVSECYNCKEISIWHKEDIVYPKPHTVAPPNRDLPEDIKTDYNEAASILSESPRGSAAILRLAIQKICIKLGAPGKNLSHDINFLVNKGMSVEVQEALDVIRTFGNNAVHPGNIDLKDTPEYANALFEILNIIADRMISEPKRIKALYHNLPNSTLEAIRKRDDN